MKKSLLQVNKKFDPLLFYATLSLSLIGLVMVLSSSSYLGALSYGDSYYFLKRQLVFFVMGFIAMLLISRIHYKIYNNPYLLMIFGFMVVLFLLLLFTPLGRTVNNATRWLQLGPLPRFSPSELAKVFLIFYYAWWINKNQEYLKTFKGYLVSFLPMILIFAMILLQPDLSTAGLIAIVTMVTLFQGGARYWHVGLSVLVGFGMAVLFVVSSPYRIKRIVAIFQPFENAMDEGYQVVKSLYALGSGGLWGLGIGNSRQKFLHLPERHTDFIFSIMGEELGYIGLLLVLALFSIVFFRGYAIAIKADSLFGRLLALGITNMLVVQSAINIAVTMGVFPTTGMTLPLISYGGTSLFITLCMIGVLLNISCNQEGVSRDLVRSRVT